MNRIHELNHPSIKLSSLNADLIAHYEKVLVGISADDIKQDNVEDRHRLLLNMGLAGNCPIFEEYFEMRSKRYEMLEIRMSNIPKKSVRYILDRTPISYEVDEELLNKYGWDFTEEPR